MCQWLCPHLVALSVVNQIGAAVFDDHHASYPITSRSSVGFILDRFVGHGHQALSPLDRSILYLITALGACSRSPVNSNKSVDFENLYALAWNLFPYAVATPSIASLQILLLHVSVLWAAVEANLLTCVCMCV